MSGMYSSLCINLPENDFMPFSGTNHIVIIDAIHHFGTDAETLSEIASHPLPEDALGGVACYNELRVVWYPYRCWSWSWRPDLMSIVTGILTEEVLWCKMVATVVLSVTFTYRLVYIGAVVVCIYITHKTTTLAALGTRELLLASFCNFRTFQLISVIFVCHVAIICSFPEFIRVSFSFLPCVPIYRSARKEGKENLFRWDCDDAFFAYGYLAIIFHTFD